jgi:SH3 domain-containing protein
MKLGPTEKPKPKLGGFSTKQLAFFGVAGLILLVGIGLRAGNFFGGPAEEETAPVAVEASPPESDAPKAAAPPEAAPAPAAVPVPETPPATQEAAVPPSEPAEPASDTVDEAKPDGEAVEQAGDPLPDPGMILVARKPVELLASPSASATVMFGFPAGRPFRVIGQEGDFAHIKDLKSGTTGWIDKAALAAPPPRAPPAAAPSQASRSAGGRKPSSASADPKPNAAPSVAEDSVAVQPRRRPGLFGRDGLFGGIFGGN